MSLLSVWQVFALCASLASALPSSNSMANKDNGYVWKPPVGQTATHDPITTCIEPGMVALTYDDGPGPYTEQLLDILEANRVTATFFVNGNNNNGPITDPKGAKAIKEVYALGHHIGSHTWSHADLAELGTKGRRLEMDRLQDALSDIIGFEPIYMRPPYFSCPSACLRDMADFGYHVVNANLDTKDYLHDYAWSRKTYTTALASGHPDISSFIVLVHDIHPETVNAFTQFMIDEAKTHGYKMVTLGECLGDAHALGWYRKSNRTRTSDGGRSDKGGV